MIFVQAFRICLSANQYTRYSLLIKGPTTKRHAVQRLTITTVSDSFCTGFKTLSFSQPAYSLLAIYSQSLYGMPLRGLSLHQQRTESTGWLKDRVLKTARKSSLVVTFVPSESDRPDQIADLIKELYILNRCTACRFEFCPFISSEHRVYWLAERQSLKDSKKIISMYIFI